MPRTASKKAELQYDDDLARGLMRARLAVGLGLREAAEEAEVDLTSIWRYEKGHMRPTLETLVRLLQMYRANLNIGPDGVMLTWLEEPRENDPQAEKKGGK